MKTFNYQTRGYEIRPAANGGVFIIEDGYGSLGEMRAVLGAFSTPADMIKWLVGQYGLSPQPQRSASLNHDLLERALGVLTHEAISAIESGCEFTSDGLFENAPVPGSCAPECVEHIETLLDLIRDIEAEAGPTEEPEPEWFADLVDRRWALTKLPEADAPAPSSSGIDDACPGDHQEVLDAIQSHNSGEDE